MFYDNDKNDIINGIVLIIIVTIEVGICRDGIDPVKAYYRT